MGLGNRRKIHCKLERPQECSSSFPRETNTHTSQTVTRNNPETSNPNWEKYTFQVQHGLTKTVRQIYLTKGRMSKQWDLNISPQNEFTQSRMPAQHHREKTFIIGLWNMRTRVTNDFLIHWLQGECLWAWEGDLSEMTACRESLVFLKHAILALVFAMSTHALKRETLKPSTVKLGFF